MCDTWESQAFDYQGKLEFMPVSGETGGAEGNRTPDLLNAIQALSQLSYGPYINVRAVLGSAQVGREDTGRP